MNGVNANTLSSRVRHYLMNFASHLHVASVKLRRLVLTLVFCTSTAALSAGQSDSSQTYPDTWVRSIGGQVFYPTRLDTRFLLQNGLSDVLFARTVFDKEMGVVVWDEMETYFGGEKFKLRQDEHYMPPTLANGEPLHVTRSLEQSIFGSIGKSLPTKRPVGLIGAVELADGTYLGTEKLLYRDRDSRVQGRDGSEQSMRPAYSCEPVWIGVTRVDALGNRLWRKTLVALETRTPSPDQRSCQGISSVLPMFHAQNISPLPDGTALVDLTVAVVRINVISGLPNRLRDDIRIVDSGTFLQFKQSVFERLEALDWWNSLPPEGKGSLSDIVHSLMLQYFMFPEKLIK